MKGKATRWLLIPVFAVAALVGWNYLSAQRHLSSVLADDSRNRGIDAFAYHQWFLNPGTLVFDLRDISGDKNALDVSRTLLQFSERMKSSRYEQVILSYRGEPRFVLDGRYFQTLGEEFEFQNPVYTLRTLPENVRNLDGTPAFDTWTGGFIGVVGEQMEDLNEFHRRWYMQDVAGG